MKKIVMLGIAAAAFVAMPRVTQAQGITITPQIGVYVPSNSVSGLRSAADSISVKREGTLALGLNVDLGFLRGSVAYASAAKLNKTGVSGQSEIGDGKLLTAAADIVLRPIPRLIVVQPYILGGAGIRNANYSYDAQGFGNAFPKSDSDFALHAGVGADIMLGPIGVSAEISDFISKDPSNKWKQHDAFGFAGLRLKL